MRASIFRAEVDLYPGRSLIHADVLTRQQIERIREIALQSLSSLRQPCREHEGRLRRMLVQLALLEPC